MKILRKLHNTLRHSKKIVLMSAAVLTLASSNFVPAAAATRYETGVATNGSLLWMSEPALHQRLDDIKNLGSTWIRVDFSWHDIQPENSTDYNWEKYDKVVRAAGSKGLKILAILGYTPSWAQEPICAALHLNPVDARRCAPANVEDFANYAGAVAAKYKGTNIRAWEIWNEPNLTGFFKTALLGSITADPTTYATLANGAATKIKENYPDSVIITGGLAPMFEPGLAGMRQSDFLAQVLPLLNADLFNGIGMHPYCWPKMPTLAADYNAFHTVDSGRAQYNLRLAMQNAGWGNKEIWATEFGASTKGSLSTLLAILPFRPDHVTEDEQASIMQQGVDAWYQKQNVGPMFVHSDTDQHLMDVRNEGGFGLRRADGEKKPAYDAFQSASARIAALKLLHTR